MGTKSINNLEYYIIKAEKDKWWLHYNKNMNLNILGIIEKVGIGYEFKPLLYNGKTITECK